MSILVTGGAGFIGSHTCVTLMAAGHDVVVVDNFSNSKRDALQRVEAISGKRLKIEEADLREAQALQQIFQRHAFSAVIHFAGLKAVGNLCKSRSSTIRTMWRAA